MKPHAIVGRNSEGVLPTADELVPRAPTTQARKMAALAAAQPVIDEEDDARKTAEIQAERDSLMATCDALGLEVMEVCLCLTSYLQVFSNLTRPSSQISPDGHCLYAAIADQLTVLGILPPNQVSPSYRVV